jgi:hypothetical protein
MAIFYKIAIFNNIICNFFHFTVPNFYLTSQISYNIIIIVR